MSWTESASEHFGARHEGDDARDARRVLGLLEETRARIAPRFPALPEDVTVVIHGSQFQLDLAQPYLLLARRLAAPAARRYIIGWVTATEVHVLAPRLARRRASTVPGSRELLELAPAALYLRLATHAVNPALPPPHSPRRLRLLWRWAWLTEGVAAYFSGQTAHVRPGIARRLHETPAPAFPPSIRDAPLLGGTVVDLIAREAGEGEILAMLSTCHLETPERALERAFGGRALHHTAGTWRAHLARLASGGG